MAPPPEQYQYRERVKCLVCGLVAITGNKVFITCHVMLFLDANKYACIYAVHGEGIHHTRRAIFPSNSIVLLYNSSNYRKYNPGYMLGYIYCDSTFHV